MRRLLKQCWRMLEDCSRSQSTVHDQLQCGSETTAFMTGDPDALIKKSGHWLERGCSAHPDIIVQLPFRCFIQRRLCPAVSAGHRLLRIIVYCRCASSLLAAGSVTEVSVCTSSMDLLACIVCSASSRQSHCRCTEPVPCGLQKHIHLLGLAAVQVR